MQILEVTTVCIISNYSEIYVQDCSLFHLSLLANISNQTIQTSQYFFNTCSMNYIYYAT